jgi:hypothetical protein
MHAPSLDASPLGWLHLSRPRENWHRLDAAARERLRGEFARVRKETAEDGAAVFGPYATAGYDEWDRFVYAEFPDLATLFRLEARLQRIDYMSYVDFANHLGRKYAGPLGTERPGHQPCCVVGFAPHDDAWYGRPRDERERIERDELGPAAAPLAAAGVTFLALNICDVTAGPRQFFLWEAPSLAIAQAVRAHWATFWRYHRGARMIVGERVGR